MMKIGSKIFVTAAIIIFIVCPEIYSQNSRVAYFMKIPQNHLLNPAIKPTSRFYIGLPALSGIYAGVGNNFISLNDIIISNLESEQIFTFQDPGFKPDQLAEKLKDNNTITSEGALQLLGLSIPVGRNYCIFIDVIDRIAAKTVFPRELMDLYITESTDFINKTIDIADLKITGQYYREYGLGFSGDIIKNLRIGAKFKLLSGMASVSFDNQLFSLKVDSNLSQTVTTNSSLDIGGQETIRRIFTDNNFLFKPENGGKTDIGGFVTDYLLNPVINSGLAFDIGAVYNLGKLFTFSASVTDLGFINWTEELESYSSNSTFTLPGITLKDVASQSFSINDLTETLRDSLQRNFNGVDSPQPFRTYLPTSILAGASINIFPVLSLGFLSESKIYAGNLKQSFIFSGNFYAGRTLSASLSYTITNSSYNNLGFGLAVKAGFAQLYLTADKIPLSWDKVYLNNRMQNLPENLSMLTLQLGLNIIFGKPVTKKTDTPMLFEEN